MRLPSFTTLIDDLSVNWSSILSLMSFDAIMYNSIIICRMRITSPLFSSRIWNIQRFAKMFMRFIYGWQWPIVSTEFSIERHRMMKLLSFSYCSVYRIINVFDRSCRQSFSSTKKETVHVIFSSNIPKNFALIYERMYFKNLIYSCQKSSEEKTCTYVRFASNDWESLWVPTLST